MKNKVRFCWMCSKKLYGNHSEILTIDSYPRTLHKMCAKEVKKGWDYRNIGDGTYVSMMWVPSEESDCF
jgi:hypothetical protein